MSWYYECVSDGSSFGYCGFTWLGIIAYVFIVSLIFGVTIYIVSKIQERRRG